MRAATSRPGNGANTAAPSFAGEVNAAVPEPVLAPRADREEPAIGARLVRLVELAGVFLELVGLLGHDRLLLVRLLGLALGEHRVAERAAQLAAERIDLERPRIQLLIPQVIVADVPGELHRRVFRDRAPVLHAGRRLRELRRDVRQQPHQLAAEERERVVLRLRVVERVDRVAVDLARLGVALRAPQAAVVVVRLLVGIAAVAHLDADRADVPFRRVIGHQAEIDRLIDRAVVIEQEVHGKAALVLEHGEAHVGGVAAVVMNDELADHRLDGLVRRIEPVVGQRRPQRVALGVRRPAAACRTARRPAGTSASDP